ncbi:hypothetical protein [Streptomyces oceani]|uniref:Uncharacterized protein n=1 Tax=Streptomyces oceani TaxID=1075402 RepID=A0A1E7KLU2_9ACTN|nr:hypothetical protein [Streptomyces oceani]OEV04939.1 hypothetical protein AN216_04785 [Streptomyces oceani]
MATDTTKHDESADSAAEDEQPDLEKKADPAETPHDKRGSEKAATSEHTTDTEDQPADEPVEDRQDGRPLDDHDDELPDDSHLYQPQREDGRGGFMAGAAAVLSVGLGLCSLTGTSFTEQMRAREEMTGQLESGASPGSPEEQIEAIYGTPWDAVALLNGFFALVAIVLGATVLVLLAKRTDARVWVRALALGGLALGVIGALVATGMYFDLFASAPEPPDMPSTPQQPQAPPPQ